jgi:hypothetical protein
MHNNNNTAGNLTLTISNYSTTPAEQQNCTIAGVQLALYRTNSCPAGQNFPAPVACRNFNGNGVLSNITNLEQNATYLVMVNGLSNTKASFTLTLNGTVLPVKLLNFTGTPTGDDNILHWEFDALIDLYDVTLQRSTDGINFETLQYWNTETFESITNYIDKVTPSISFYRLVFTDREGVVNYSSIIQVKHKVNYSWKVYPNPAKGNIHIYAKNIPNGHYIVMVFNSSGMLLTKKDQTIGLSAQNFIIPVTTLPPGNYKVVVTDWVAKPVFTSSVAILP